MAVKQTPQETDCRAQLESHGYWQAEADRLGVPGAKAVYERAAYYLRRYMVRNGIPLLSGDTFLSITPGEGRVHLIASEEEDKELRPRFRRVKEKAPA